MKTMKIMVLCCILIFFTLGCAKKDLPFPYDNKIKVDSMEVLDVASLPINMNVPSFILSITSYTNPVYINQGIARYYDIIVRGITPSRH